MYYDEEDIVRDDNDKEVSPLYDDYAYWKNRQDDCNNPLSDDYNKYYHE